MDGALTLLSAAWLGKPLWMWLGFHAVIFLLLAFDLGVLHKDTTREIGVRESLYLSAFYISIGLAFATWIWVYVGENSAEEYLTGFIIEKSLSADNVFVIAMIFSTLGIPRNAQYKVLYWGILAVIVLRGLMIGIGAALVTRFDWLLYLFAAFLVFTGLRMIRPSETSYDVTANPLVSLIYRKVRVTEHLHGQRFLVRRADADSGKMILWMTPLFLALILINVADAVFAVDSIPAIFAITTDTFIVYTSNIFAILGLRALYFALAAMIDRFKYLKYALAATLIFIGLKVFVADMLGIAKIPPSISLSVTAALIATGIAYSLWRTRRE